MECKIIIDKEHKEEVLVYAHKRTHLTEQIERLVFDEEIELIGYKNKEALRLDLNEVCCFLSEQNKVYALIGDDKFQLKCRLYNLEEKLSENFVKINQSCIANIRKIQRFSPSISGSLIVKFKNGYSDYVSRRQLKNVKERIGI